MRRSDTLLMSHLEEIRDRIDAGVMTNMTDEEKDQLGWEIREIVVELFDLGEE